MVRGTAAHRVCSGIRIHPTIAPVSCRLAVGIGFHYCLEIRYSIWDPNEPNHPLWSGRSRYIHIHVTGNPLREPGNPLSLPSPGIPDLSKSGIFSLAIVLATCPCSDSPIPPRTHPDTLNHGGNQQICTPFLYTRIKNQERMGRQTQK